jgi:DNA-binding transcriptional LysR family regulator
MITLEQLSSFKATYETLGYSSAGRMLGKDRATVREHVISLEIAVGKTLFNVIGKKLAPTPVAVHLYPKAKHITKQSMDFEKAALSIFETDLTEIIIHHDTHVPNTYLSKLTNNISDAFPHIKIRLLHKTRQKSMLELEEGRAHFSIMSSLGDAFAKDSVGVSYLGSTYFYGYAHPSSPLLNIENLTLRDLSEEIQYVSENSNTNPETALKHSNVYHVVSNIDLIVIMMEEKGWSVLNMADAKRYEQAGWIKQLQVREVNEPFSIGIALFEAYEYEMNETVKSIKSVIRSTATSHLG